MKKRILAVIVMAAIVLAAGCQNGELNVSETSEATSNSSVSTAPTSPEPENTEYVTDESLEAENQQSTEAASEPTKETVQDSVLTTMSAQELYNAACELRNRDVTESKTKTYTYESFPQEDGTVCVLRSSFVAGLLDAIELYTLSESDDGLQLGFNSTIDLVTRQYLPEGYLEPTIDYTDPTSLIDPDGLSADEIYTMIDDIQKVFSYIKVGHCEDGYEGGICTYDGNSSFEWLESMFKKYFTDELFNDCYDEESGWFINIYQNDNGTCTRKRVSFGGPQPEVESCEIVSQDDSEIVVRTYLSGRGYGGEDFTVLSALTNTENGWKISRCNERE